MIPPGPRSERSRNRRTSHGLPGGPARQREVVRVQPARVRAGRPAACGPGAGVPPAHERHPRRGARPAAGPGGDDPEALSAPANGAAEPRLLAIDDIDLLDASSMSLLAQSLDRRRFRLVATVRSREAPAVFRTLRAVGRSAIVHVEPWHDEELTGSSPSPWGPDAPATVRRLLDFTGGNALCLTELVELGSYDGHLRREHEFWTWTATCSSPAHRGPGQRGAGERVGEGCAGGCSRCRPRRPGAARGPGGAARIAAVEAADTTGLLLREATEAISARPRSAVQGRVLAQLVPTTRRRRLAAALLEALAEPALPTQRLELPAAHLAVDCSVAVLRTGRQRGAGGAAAARARPRRGGALSHCRSAAITNEPTCSRLPCWPRAVRAGPRAGRGPAPDRRAARPPDRWGSRPGGAAVAARAADAR